MSDFYELHKKMLQKYGSESSANEGKKQKATQSRPETPRNAYVTSDGGKTDAYKNFMNLHKSIQKKYEKVKAGSESTPSTPVMKKAPVLSSNSQKTYPAYTPTRTRQEYDSAIATGKKELSLLEELLSKKQDFGTFLRNTYTMTPAAASAQEAATRDAWAKEYGYGSWKDAQNRYDALQREMYFLESGMEYDEIPTIPGFEQASKVDSSYKKDNTYAYINNIDGFRNRQYSGAMSGGGANKTYAGYDKMTDYEVGTYNAIYATEGKEAAEKYLEYLSYSLSERDAKEAKENAEYFARKAPVLSDVMSTPMNLVGGVEGAVDVLGQKVAQGVTGQYKPTDFNRGTLASQAGSAIRGYRSEQLNDLSGTVQIDAEKNPVLSRFLNGKGVGDLYQLGMSMVDSGAAAGISAMTGTGWLGGALLGTSAGTQAMIEAANSGATDSQAIWTGITNGAFEMLFEKVSIDRLLSYDGKNIIKSILTQGMVEGSEEAATSVANTLADIYIMAADSEWSELVDQYMAAGDDLETARWKALRDKAVDVAYDFAAGSLTGGIMGGGASAVQNVTNRFEETATLREIAPDLVAESQELSGDTELGTRIQERIESGKKVAGRDLRALVAQNDQAIAAQIATQAEAKLTEQGETENVTEVAQVVGKMATGQRLTRQEAQIFRESPNAADVLNEINEAEATTETPTQEATETAQEAQIPAPVEVEGEGRNVAVEAPVARESASVPAPAAEIAEPTETDVKAAQGATLYEDETRELEANSKQYGEQAEAYIRSFDAGQNIAEYDTAWKAGYELGMSQVPQAQAMESSDLSYLTPGQRVDAYEAGLKAAGVMAEQKEARVQGMTRNATGARKRGIVRAYNGINTATLAQKFNDSQRKAYKILSTIADVTGIEIVLYESTPEADGVYREAQGKYIRSQPGRIFVDLNAGISHVSEVGDMANYTMLSTFTHEFVHFCENWNPVRYNELRKAVFDAMAENNINVEERIDQLMAESNGELSREDASREAVAEALVEILPDANFVERLANEHKTLFQKLLERLKEFLRDIKDYFAGMRKSNDKTVAALKEEVDGMARYMDHIVKLFDNVAVEAVNRMQEAAMDEFVTYDEDTKSVAPIQYSRRTWTESEYAKNKEAAVVAISLQLGVTKEQARQYIEDIDSIAALIGDDAVRLDYEPNLDPLATVIKPNSEYKWTVDMSTLCAKRLWYTGTFDAIQRRLGNAVFDSDAMIKLRSMMMDAGYEVACGICYVESTRREIGPITRDFIERYKEAQQTGEPIQRINAKGKPVVLKGKGHKAPFYAEDGYTPTMADLNTTDIDMVKQDHPEVYKAYLAYMNARGQAKPKLLETRAEYKGEILKHFKTVRAVNARNSRGGLRLQSFSDFEVPHMIDMMQIVMDMSRVGLKSQAYTKVPAFADIFGGTGVKINLSLIAKGSGLDANGNLIFDDVEGMPHKEAFRLREKWSDNVGTILVGKNDDHIRAAMNDPRIDFIIPFHKSSWKESLYGALGLTGYEDYTETQNEKPLDPSRKIKNFDPSEYWVPTKTGDENAEIYLEKCRQDGRQPKFPKFAGEPGYWKLLIDFKMYNNEGVGIPQEVVKPDFDMDAARKVLADYKGGHQKLPVAKDIVEKFVAEYESGTQFQRRPANRLSDLEVLNAAADGLEGLSLTEAEENSLGVMRQKLARLAPISEQIEEHERLAEEYAERDPEEAQKERNRAIVLKAKQTRELNSILAGANGPIMRRVLQKARSIVERQELTEYRASRKESELAKRYKARIEKDVNELIAWGMKPDTKNAMKHIPEGIKGPVMDFLEAIDFSSKRKLAGGEATQKDTALFAKLSALHNAFYGEGSALDEQYRRIVLSDALKAKMEEIQSTLQKSFSLLESGESAFNLMNRSELESLSSIVKQLKKFIQEYNVLYKNAAFQHVAEAGADSAEGLKKMSPIKNARATAWFDWGMTRPADVWERFGEGGKSIFRELQVAQGEEAFRAQEVIEYAAKTYQASEVKAWEKEVKTIKLSNGEDVKMTVAQIMSLYKLREREQAMSHIRGEGIRIAELQERQGKSPIKKAVIDQGHTITDDDLDTIISELNDRQKAVADALQKYMQDKGSEWGNRVTLIRFGEKLFGEPKYFPIHVYREGMSASLDESVEAASLYALLNMGFTKQTKKDAQNQIVIYSIFDEFSVHMSNMALYSAYALPVVDAIKWLNYKDAEKKLNLRDELARVYGRKKSGGTNTGIGYAEDFILDMLKAINGTDQEKLGWLEKQSNQITSRYNRAQVAANISVAIQQPLSVLRAADIVSAGSISAGVIRKVSHFRQTVAEMEKHSGIAVWKKLGFYDVNISRGVSTMIKHDESLPDWLSEKGMVLAEFMDRWAWASMWEASKKEVETKKKLKQTDEGYWDAVNSQFDEIVFKTQVVDSPLTKPKTMRTKSAFVRPFTSFMMEPLTTVMIPSNIIYDYRVESATNGVAKTWGKYGKKFTKAMAIYTICETLNALIMAAFIDVPRDDDEYPTWWEKFTRSFLERWSSNMNPLNKIPVVSKAWKAILLYLKEKDKIDYDVYKDETAIESMFNDMATAYDTLRNKLSGKDTNYTTYSIIYNLAKGISGLTGIPASSAMREAVTAWNNTVGKLYPNMQLTTYNPDPKQDIRTAYENGNLTDEEALEAMKDAKVSVPDAYTKTPEVAYKGYLRYWAYKSANPKDESVEDTWFIAYGAKGVDTAGIKLETYLDYREKARDKKNERKTWTDKKKEETSEKEILLDLIDSINLTSKQKDALYAAEGWSPKTISEAPWH